ncbi:MULTISPECIES: LVIVD repeat-containing protein [Zobellia]|uniref:Conserved hypothetical lipoprotein n=1 Tax=Zobellia galactanivorans (strain DSM 12802 / CCUG 47099 / CIP 106680 / NCIMB 13871 / Dsij) TaxID=63186 RepID=G0L6N6_ZOBGA|nr:MULTISPECIES: hypothetical protein [Zobellia]CAZ98544.1 Conserved hypothetical lipoprotein [Zobellia galactanivorans]
MMKKLSLVALAASTIILSCSDETTVFKDTEDDISIEAEASVLENSILFDDAGVLEIKKTDGSTGKTSKTIEEMAGDYPLTLVARVDPPSYTGGDNLTASHIDVDGNYAYVSYNTVEDGYAGGIDIIDVSDPNNPKVTSRLYYSNADINAVEYDNGYVYAVGGVDSEKSVRATSNSFIVKIPASGGILDVSRELIYGFQEGFTANDVEVTTNGILVTSGKDGLLTYYKKTDLSTKNDVSFSDLRSVAYDNGVIAVLDASQGVSIMDENFVERKIIAIDSDFGQSSKRTLDFSGEKIIVSEGAKGAGVYNMDSGSLIEYIPILLNPVGTETENIVTNAVAMNEDILLMANGGAGLCLSEDVDGQTNIVGVVDLDGSINYVASKGDYIFAASGKAGLQIVKLNRPDQSLENRCSDLDPYYGSANLYVSEGDVKEYNGSKRFNKLEVDGSLLLCGTWTVNSTSYVNSNGRFEMNGTLVVGRNNKRKNIVVNKDAVLRIEGNLYIYGDLILNEGATVEFIGDDSVANIFGSVKLLENAKVKGTFKDLQGKF